MSFRFPNESYEELTSRRLNNWNLLKGKADLLKTSGGTLSLKGDRLEIYVPDEEKITIEDGDSLTLLGKGVLSTSLVAYPLAPKEGVRQQIFYQKYGSHLQIQDLTIDRDAIKKYETYSCVLKKSSNAKLIEVLGSIRPEFWNNLEIGKTLFYGWAVSTKGESNTVASWDEEAKTITLLNNISGAVGNDTSGTYVKFGTYFEQEISLSDYNTYGGFWYLNEGFEYVSSSESWVDQDDLILSLQGVHLSGGENNVKFTSGAAKIYATDTKFSRCQIGISFFTNLVANNQEIHCDNLTFEDCGYVVDGGIYDKTAANILGSGAYVHPNVAIKKIGTGRLFLTNNTAAAFRQYSSSGDKPVALGATTEFGIVTASGNPEYDLFTSNSMPVTIDEYNTDNIGDLYVGGSLNLNGGIINRLTLTAQSEPSSSVDTTININNCEINNYQAYSWSSNRMIKTTINYVDCIFKAKNVAIISHLIGADTDKLKKLTITGGSFVMSDTDQGSYYTIGEPTTGKIITSRLIRRVNIDSCTITNFTTENLYGGLFISELPAINPDNFGIFKIINSNINMYQLEASSAAYYAHSYSYEGVLSKVAGITLAGISLNNNLTPKIGVTSKEIISSDTYNRGTLYDVLELDTENNEYNIIGGGNVKITGLIFVTRSGVTFMKSIGTNMLGAPIIINAIGGDVVFQKFDAITNPESNVKNDYTCLAGQSCKLTPDTKEVFSTSANSTENTNLGTGDGVTKIFKGYLDNNPYPKVVGTALLAAGAISGSVDSDGIITGTGITKGQIDFYGPSYYVEFDVAPPAATPIVLSYDKYNGHKWTGSVTVSAL